MDIYIIYLCACVCVCVCMCRCHPQVPTGQTDEGNIINGYLSAVKGFLGNNRCFVCVCVYVYNVHILLDFILPTSMLIEV